jgi:hypothetical protein
MNTKGKGRFKRRALALLFGCVISFLLAEGGLRVLLFWDTPALEKSAHKLRQPGYYADMAREDLYWKLVRIWTPREHRDPFGRFSEKTGWTSPLIDSKTLVSEDEQKVGARRPVLLYGDSFSECVTPPEQAWQGLLERSPESKQAAIVNFGVSGFGTDQAFSMLDATIDRFAARNPLVVFGIFLDEDPDRAMLSFRGMPKPRYTLEGGDLVFHPLEEHDPQTWWDNHPPGVASYIWRLLRGPHGPLPYEWQEKLSPLPSDAQVIALTRAILARVHQRLEALHVEHFVLGFQGRMMLENPMPHLWRERFVRDACSELGMHFLSSRPYLLSAVGWKKELLGQTLFVTQGSLEGHFNARGNVVVLEAFRQAIQGRYEHEDISGVDAAMRRMGVHPEMAQDLDLDVLGRPATLHFYGPVPTFAMRETDPKETARKHVLGLFPSRNKPTLIEWHLADGQRFRAEAVAVPSGSADPSAEAVRVSLLVDGMLVKTLELKPGAQPLLLEAQLHAPCTLGLRAEPLEGHSQSCWARLAQPSIE